MSKFIKLDKNFKTLTKLNINRSQIVLVGGCFDILHIGHIAFLQKAKQAGKTLVVLLENDQTINLKKGINRPIFKQEDRVKMLLELKSVDYVLLLPSNLNDKKYDLLVKKIKPAIIATTYGDAYVSHKLRQAEQVGAKLVYIKKIKGSSTSNIAKLLARDRNL